MDDRHPAHPLLHRGHILIHLPAGPPAEDHQNGDHQRTDGRVPGRPRGDHRLLLHQEDRLFQDSFPAGLRGLHRPAVNSGAAHLRRPGQSPLHQPCVANRFRLRIPGPRLRSRESGHDHVPGMGRQRFSQRQLRDSQPSGGEVSFLEKASCQEVRLYLPPDLQCLPDHDDGKSVQHGVHRGHDVHHDPDRRNKRQGTCQTGRGADSVPWNNRGR